MNRGLEIINEKDLIKLLDEDSLRKFECIKKMLSGYGLKLKVMPSDYEDEPNVFYFRITDTKDEVSVFYDHPISNLMSKLDFKNSLTV